MSQPPENEATTSHPVSDDQNSWLERVKLLLERSVLACGQIGQLCQEVIASQHPSADQQYRLEIMPTEMMVAMHNVRVAIEEALLALAALGLPGQSEEEMRDIFIDKKGEDESTNLDLLFQCVVEKGGPQGFMPVANIQVPAGMDVTCDELEGSLEYLQELTAKYQKYDFENVPTSLEGACWKGKSNPFQKSASPDETCGHLQTSEPAKATVGDPEELRIYEKMGQELIEDANAIYGQFCAIGMIYQAALQE